MHAISDEDPGVPSVGLMGCTQRKGPLMTNAKLIHKKELDEDLDQYDNKHSLDEVYF